jgi:programmed cell death protein 5
VAGPVQAQTRGLKTSREGCYDFLRPPELMGSLCTTSTNTKWKRKQESEARATMLSQILEPAAADRLGRIRMVKESRATDVENRLIMLARAGQLRQKVTEEQLKDMLGSLAEQERETSGGLENMRVVRRGSWDDDDLDDLLEGT